MRVDLRAAPALWRPENDESTEVQVFAFSEPGRPPQIPAPFIRVRQGDDVRVAITNDIPPGMWIGLPPPNRRFDGIGSATESNLVVHGIAAAADSDEIVRIPYGETREVRFIAERPGRHLYWAAAADRPLYSRTGPDAQMTGLLVVDPLDGDSDPDERFFVISMTDAYPDPDAEVPGEDVFETVINGLSWPHTERLRYHTGDLIRWRWINGSGFEHPMHLHGFHFRTRSRGDGKTETVPEEEEVQHVVTELMEPGSSFLMEWTPTRPGNWLMHCHVRDHVTPVPERDVREMEHDQHDVRRHALYAMAGLVMGITVVDDRSEEIEAEPMRHLTLVARQRNTSKGKTPVRGYALETENLAATGAFSVPGPPIMLTQGEMTRITVVNHIDQPTSVHWHGLELQSYYDGVPGWSGDEDRVAPLIEPGGNFDAFIAPPRAGTFIYHTHMDETEQLRSGMYGPLIVVERGSEFDPSRDKIIVIADTVDAENGEYQGVTINGSNNPAPMTLRAGESYRIRFIDIGETATVNISLVEDNATLAWRAIAKDGADLPPKLQAEVPALFRMGTGETYDFEWAPDRPMSAEIIVDWPFPTFVGKKVIRQKVIVE